MRLSLNFFLAIKLKVIHYIESNQTLWNRGSWTISDFLSGNCEIFLPESLSLGQTWSIGETWM